MRILLILEPLLNRMKYYYQKIVKVILLWKKKQNPPKTTVNAASIEGIKIIINILNYNINYLEIMLRSLK